MKPTNVDSYQELLHKIANICSNRRSTDAKKRKEDITCMC